MTYGYKISGGLAGAVLLAAVSFLLSYSAAAEASAVFYRAALGMAIAAAVVAVAVAIFGLAYVGTARQRAAATRAGSAPAPTTDDDADAASGDGPRKAGAAPAVRGKAAAGLSGYAPDRLDLRPVKPSKYFYNMALIFLGILFVSSAAGTGLSLSALVEMPVRMWDYTLQMIGGVAQVPDEEARAAWSTAFDAMLESVAIAWIGTLVGALFSLPCGILAARNLTPLGIYIPMRLILSIIRAIPELVFAVAIFIPLLGVGPAHMGGAMAGAFALGISSIGTLSKLISEAIEGVDNGPLEASRASGATHAQMVRWAVLPQVMPEVIAIWLYRFEVNIRASAILGALGAGGIGRLISPPNGLFGQRPYDWEAIGITLCVIILVTMVVDQLSGFVRHRVIHGPRVRQKKQRKNRGANLSVPVKV